jgi:hypothetical protein
MVPSANADAFKLIGANNLAAAAAIPGPPE